MDAGEVIQRLQETVAKLESRVARMERTPPIPTVTALPTGATGMIVFNVTDGKVYRYTAAGAWKSTDQV